jgi:hypothetical protein
MSAPWIERHGGLWLNRSKTRDRLVTEQYDAVRDAFILIWQRASDGHFQVEYLVKGKAHTDPQRSLPLWGNIAGPGIFGTLNDAQVHLEAIANKHHKNDTGA